MSQRDAEKGMQRMCDRGRLWESSKPLSTPQHPHLRPYVKKRDRKIRYGRIASAIALMGGCAIANFPNRSLAQSNIVPDATLGAESSFVVPNFNGLPVEAIAGGAIRGQNLFHSFAEFNVSEGRGAYFFSPNAAIVNILARVTGTNPSQILGTLGTFGNSSPNLFLMNPNGIIFGQNASLDVGGSFVATTANAIRLGNTGLFSATQPQTSNLLTVNPSAFFYNQLANQRQIVNRSTATTTVLGTPTIGLQVPDGRSLLLVGGDVRLEGGLLFALGGRIELGGVAQNGTIELTTNANELRLGFPADAARANVSLTNQAEVNVRAGGGGSIAINARNVEVLGGSKVRAGIASGLGSPDSKAGNIEINATGTVTVAGAGFIANAVQAGGVGKGGDINITTESLLVTEGGQVNALTFGQGDAGSVTIFAPNLVSFDGTDPNGNSGGAASIVEPGAVGNAGNINITTGSLFVTNGSQLSSSTFGEGNAGSVRITATDTVSFDGVGTNGFPSGALSSVEAGAVGNGGDIEINTNSLSVTNGARLMTNTSGQGNAGSIRITATNTVSFDGVGSNGRSSLATSAVGAGALGNGGDINITTGSLSVSNGAFLIASTYGRGNAGSVRITATDTVSFDGVGSNGITSGVNSDVGAGAVGNGGDIEIRTNSLSVSNGASLSAITSGKGNAGRVRIHATDTINFDRGDISSFVYLGAVGDGGDIEINTGSLSISNDAFLLADTFGQGNAGSVKITATDTVRFDGSYAASAVGSGVVGNGGDIEISSSSLSFTNGAFLSTSTSGQGNAGNVRIRATDTVRFDGVGSNGLFSKVSSSVVVGAVGNGGDIEITTGSLEVTNGAFLSADTFGRGNAGSVRITSTDKVRFDGVASNGASSGAFSSVGSSAIGDGGDIEITASSLLLSNGASLFAGTSGQGNSGNVKITANDSLSVTNGAYLSTSTAGQGNAGSVRINVGDSVSFDGVASNGVYSAAFSSVEKGAVGNGGDIEITTNSLSFNNGASLFAGTFGKGNAGSVRVNATDTARFDGGFATTL
ncbi:MAG TPA: filamentous hemagglutinin N-terminal domain-containing protein, partial [Stenomitos sp.]